jgi:Sporulation and spore germination
MRPIARTLVVLTASLALAGCTLVPTGGGPRTLSVRVPFGLSNKTLPGGSGASVHFVTLPIYLENQAGQLVAASRLFAQPVTTRAIFDSLLAGPTKADRRRGLTTALSPGLVVGESFAAHSAVVAFSATLLNLSPTVELRVLGQVACTLASAGISSHVTISVDDIIQTITLPDGSLTTDLGAAQFTALVAR